MMNYWKNRTSESLEARRVKRLEKFVLKVEKNPRFAEKWLDENKTCSVTRKHNKYVTLRSVQCRTIIALLVDA